MIRIVNHPKTGKRYIFGSTETPGGGMVYRAFGPLYRRENPSEEQMVEWLNNKNNQDACEDGEWLNRELEETERAQQASTA